jgi:hypothetical protein
MIDRCHAGMYCRTVQYLTTRDGRLPQHSGGTIQYEIENLGRQLVFVQWENGMNTPVFREEIEICDQSVSIAA